VPPDYRKLVVWLADDPSKMRAVDNNWEYLQKHKQAPTFRTAIETAYREEALEIYNLIVLHLKEAVEKFD
jgi:hypothetical protein